MNKEQQVEEMNKRKPPKAGTTPSPKTINEERQKDEIILIVKQAFNANSGWADEDAYVIDSNDVYHTAKETSEALYNAGYRKTFTSDLASDTQKAYKEGYEKGFNAKLTSDFIKYAQKQAVKEFAEKLQKELPCRDYTFNGIIYSMILTSSVKYVIDKLLKEYEK